LPYDLVFDVDGSLVKIQVKSALFDGPSGNYVVDNRRTKTNRRIMVREASSAEDFDFALVYVEDIDIFYVFPCEVFIGYGSEIHLSKPTSASEDQNLPIIAVRGNSFHNGLHTGKLMCEHLTNSGKPLAG